MGTTMRQPLTLVKGSHRASGLRKANLDHHADGRRVNHFLRIPPYPPTRPSPPPVFLPCDRFQRFSPAACFSRAPPRGPIVASSSLPTSQTAMASTNAWRRAKNAARTQRCPIAGHGISRRPLRTAGSIPTKLPARCRKPARIAVVRLAESTSPSPASAKLPSRLRRNTGKRRIPVRFLIGPKRGRNAAEGRNHRTLAAETA